MNKSELNSQLFETILKAAVAEDFQRELDAIPTADILKKEYVPSPELRLKIQRMVKKENHKAVFHKIMQIAKKAAVIVAIIIPVSLGSLLSVEASRNAIFNAVMEWKSDHANISFQQDSSSQALQDIDETSLYKPQYLPAGFAELEVSKYGNIQRIKYQNKENVNIILEQGPLSKVGRMMVDTEHTTYKEITLNGQKAFLFAAKTPNDNTYILWQSGKISFEIKAPISQQELIKMAESVKLEKK